AVLPLSRLPGLREPGREEREAGRLARAAVADPVHGGGRARRPVGPAGDEHHAPGPPPGRLRGALRDLPDAAAAGPARLACRGHLLRLPGGPGRDPLRPPRGPLERYTV